MMVNLRYIHLVVLAALVSVTILMAALPVAAGPFEDAAAAEAKGKYKAAKRTSKRRSNGFANPPMREMSPRKD
jgi:hypothetical protein